MKMLKQKRQIKRAIALCGFIWLGSSFPSAAQLPRFEEPRSPAPKPASQPAPQPPTRPKPPAPQQTPAPKPSPPVSPPSDAVPIVVPAPEPVSPPSDAVPIVVPPPSTSPSPTPKPPTPVPPPAARPSVDNTTAPLPEQRQETLAVLSPVNGLVSVKLINRTLATINYEIIGDTTLRTLPGKSEVTLRGLMLPANVAFRRNDNGFLLVQGTVNKEGILELNMTETNVFDWDRTTLSIEENGSAFLN